jgi:4-methyl-5(b-hydroxyethyl)-thiazole monophosphate biosynthesis
MKGIFIFLADGFEEIEALATLDVLRRGGVEVQTVSILDDPCVTGAHRIPVLADLTYSEFKAEAQLKGTTREDVLVFPGGLPGAKYLAEHTDLMEEMKRHYAEGGTVAAICAAPGLVASQLLDLKGRKFTCYDGFEDPMIARGAEYVKAPVVTDRNLITGRGPGCAIDFALAILKTLKGEAVADQVRQGMMIV